ncbi:MAG TPA: nitrate reductase associated protein, partial [Polyangiales bacterium]|nr:nitrate reductase associated protein [Polyangiales bacterium]
MLYAFDEADAELRLLPMASRRALDAAGIKLSLASYQTLALDARRELLRLGGTAVVDIAAVGTLLAAAERSAAPVYREPAELPDGLARELAIDAALWQRLSALDRYVLDKLHSRGRSERLQRAFAEIAADRLQGGVSIDVAKASVPAGCTRSERRIPSPGGSLALYSYRPAAAHSGERAGLVFFHAGAHVSGSAQSHAAFCGELSRAANCVVVSCEYRLAPEARFPSALDDAYFAACFVHEHADEFGIDHKRLGIGGIEVGAALATGVARLAKERRNPALGLQLLLCPRLDLRAPELSSQLEAYASEAERADPRCSPLAARNLIGLPPVLLVAGEDAQDAEAYAARLREAHVEVALERAAGSGYAFL